MPIRTQTIEQAAREFVKQYKVHIKKTSMGDPRECSACVAAYENLVFALDGNQSSRNNLRVLSGGADIIDLFEGTE